MGLFDIIIPALCFNTTCIDDYEVEPYCFNVPCPPENGEIANIRSRHHVSSVQLAAELEGQELVVTTLENGELSGTVKRNDILVGNGVAFELFDILKEKYRFNYTVLKPKDSLWGSSKSGVLGLLVNNEANLTAAFLPVLPDFYNLTTYSPSLDMGVWVAMMKRPKESATGSGLLAPFTLAVWMLILVSLLVVGPIIYLLILLKAKICKEDNDVVFSLQSCVWFVYGALLKQGTTLSPTTDSSRILFATWWIFITILTAFYTANLTAFLTLSKFTLPINSAEDIGRKRYSWVTNKGNAIEDIIRSENNALDHFGVSTLKPLGTVLGDSHIYSTSSDAVILEKYVQKKDMIFLREKPIADFVMYESYKMKTKQNEKEENRCTFVMTKFNITAYPRAFAYSKNFKYHHIFDNAIQHLVESGIVKFKLGVKLPDTEICPLDLGSKERQLRNSDLLMTYIIVGVGFSIAAAAFIIEMVIKYKKMKDDRKNDLFTRNIKRTQNHDQFYGFHTIKESQRQAKFKTPPPPYNSLFVPSASKKMTINGREYYIKDSKNGQSLVPMRTPSALLFQYTN